MCPMDHVPTTQIENKSMTNKARKLKNKNHNDEHNKFNHNG